MCQYQARFHFTDFCSLKRSVIFPKIHEIQPSYIPSRIFLLSPLTVFQATTRTSRSHEVVNRLFGLSVWRSRLFEIKEKTRSSVSLCPIDLKHVKMISMCVTVSPPQSVGPYFRQTCCAVGGRIFLLQIRQHTRGKSPSPSWQDHSLYLVSFVND